MEREHESDVTWLLVSINLLIWGSVAIRFMAERGVLQ